MCRGRAIAAGPFSPERVDTHACIKLCRLASKKHRFDLKMVSEAISLPLISQLFLVVGGHARRPPYLLCTYATTTNLTTSKLMATAMLG